MPLLKLQLSTVPSSGETEKLLSELSKMITETTGKPQQYVMVIIEAGVAIGMAGTNGPAAFAEVRGIGGLNAKVNKTISAKLCAIVQEKCAIAPDRVYSNFFDIDATNWGWNSGTFG